MKYFYFSIFNYNKLGINEFRDFYAKIKELVLNYQPDALGIRFEFDKFLVSLHQLDAYHPPLKGHPLTAGISELRQQRSQIIRGICSQIIALNKTNRVYNIEGLNDIIRIYHQYLKPLEASNSSRKSDFISDLFRELENKQNLNNSLVSCHLDGSFNELKKLNDNYIALLHERTLERSEMSRVKTIQLRNESYDTLNILLNSIELAKLKNSEINYDPLINSINETIGYYSMLIKGRETQRKQSRKQTMNSKKETTAANGNSDAVA